MCMGGCGGKKTSTTGSTRSMPKSFAAKKTSSSARATNSNPWGSPKVKSNFKLGGR